MKSETQILFSEEVIAQRVAELGHELTAKHRGLEPVCVCILNGSFIFFADLIRAIHLDITCEFVEVSADRKTLSPHISDSVKGKPVIVVEDLVESGGRLASVAKSLQDGGAESVTTVSLLVKSKKLNGKSLPDYYGFEIDNIGVVGYGLDDGQGENRNLPYIAIN